MGNILGENGSVSVFLDFISPLLNMVYTIVSVEVFGMPLWTILLNMLVCFTVIGFITKGSVGIGSGASSASVGASEKAKGRELDRKEEERKNRIGFGP